MVGSSMLWLGWLEADRYDCAFRDKHAVHVLLDTVNVMAMSLGM